MAPVAEKAPPVRARPGDILTNSYVLTFVAFAIDEMGSPPGEGRADGVYRKPRRRPADSTPTRRPERRAHSTKRAAKCSMCYKKAPPVSAQHADRRARPANTKRTIRNVTTIIRCSVRMSRRRLQRRCTMAQHLALLAAAIRCTSVRFASNILVACASGCRQRVEVGRCDGASAAGRERKAPRPGMKRGARGPCQNRRVGGVRLAVPTPPYTLCREPVIDDRQLKSSALPYRQRKSPTDEGRAIV